MAAAVFEALFHGDDRYEFNRDPGAVVIWFSDDPSLNEQTRFRLMESSDRLQHTDLVVVENTFNSAKFAAGKIYFLNTQKLGKKSLLVRGFDTEGSRRMWNWLGRCHALSRRRRGRKMVPKQTFRCIGSICCATHRAYIPPS